MRHGLLGHVDLTKEGRGSTGLVNASLKVLQNFCTVELGRPLSTAESSKQGRNTSIGLLNEELFASIKEKVVVINADAASVEVVTLEELDSKAADHFPNNLVILKDITHAARRYAHELLHAVMCASNLF